MGKNEYGEDIFCLAENDVQEVALLHIGRMLNAKEMRDVKKA